MKHALTIVISLLFLQACENNDATETATLFYGGSILTMDDSNPSATAMFVKNDKIIAVGKEAALRAEYPNVIQYNLEGRTIIPGIVDSHAHVRQLGAESIKANLVGTNTVEEMVDRLQAFYPNPAPGQWLIGQGWDEGVWGSKGYPDRKALDEAFPNNPVLLQSLHGFAGFYNGAAFAEAGITADTPNPAVGQILRRPDGEATGVLLTLARNLVESKAPPLTHEQLKEAILAGLNQMAAAGVTSVHEAGINPSNLAAFQDLADNDQLPIRVYGLLDGNNKKLMARMFEDAPITHDGGMFTARGIKVYYDGSLGSRTALLREPYSDKPEGANPTERITPIRVAELAASAAAKGFQMAVHTIGDEGNDRILNIYANAFSLHPDKDHRWRLEHAQIVLPNFYERVASMKVISSMQPSHAVGDSGWAEDRVGADRIKHAYAWRRILDAGGRIIFNSDLPGEPWTPMETLYFAVTRNKLSTPGAEGWYADQALSVEESLKAMTSEGAYAAFQEDKLGKIAPGFLADFIELGANPIEVDPASIKDIAVTATWVNGKKLKRT